jgi:hypothetical protein
MELELQNRAQRGHEDVVTLGAQGIKVLPAN